MPKQSKQEYERLGKMLVDIYETGFSDRKKLLKHSFLRGLAAGFGGVLGATILIAILIWVLSLLDNVPLLGRVFENLRSTVQSK